jgi:hypothetical protein
LAFAIDDGGGFDGDGLRISHGAEKEEDRIFF